MAWLRVRPWLNGPSRGTTVTPYSRQRGTVSSVDPESTARNSTGYEVSWARSISRVARNARPALNVGMTTDTRWATATLPGRAGAQCGRGPAARPAPDAPIPQTGGGVPEGNEGYPFRRDASLRAERPSAPLAPL